MAHPDSPKGRASHPDEKEARALATVMHRRPAYRVIAPALVRHVCWRDAMVASWSADEGEEAVTKMNSFIEEVNGALREIHRRCGIEPVSEFKPHAGAPSASHDAQRQDTGPRKEPHETLLIALQNLPPPLNSWRARLRIDLHAEYYSVTSIFDQPPAKNEQSSSSDAFRAQRVNAFQRTLCRKRPLAAAHHPAMIAAVYAKIWEEIDRFFVDVRWPGDPFTEFRGAAFDIGDSRRSPQQPIVEEWAAEARVASRQRRQSLRQCLNRNRVLFRTLLQISEASSSGQPDADVNCVLCEVLDGNAIYGSSLAKPDESLPAKPDGSLLAKPGSDADHNPLRYFVLCNGLSGYQLGRLLRRLHVLGELRLAAMLDLEKLHRAGIEIRALGNWINERQPKQDSPTVSGSAPKPKAVKMDFTELQQKLTAVAYRPPADPGITSQADPSIAGGLPYRVNRSRSYAQAFKNRVIELRVRRLEGWEPYDLFVQRTLYQEFDFIDAVGRRYEAMEARAQRLTQAQNLLTQAQNLRKLEEVSRGIHHILAIGEIIGWTAFAYYFGQILAKFIKYVPVISSNADVLATLVALILGISAFAYFARQRDRLHSDASSHTTSRASTANAVPSGPPSG